MALLRCDFFSDVLDLSTSMTVILPQATDGQIGMAGTVTAGPAPVLYLLHGLSDDDTSWVRRTSIERYVDPLGLAVVMPEVHRSCYTDQAHGGRYWTFLSEELPAVVGSFFRVSQRREDTFVAGLSMGGYGALKWALRCPDRFAAAASLSGALDMATRAATGFEPDPALMATVFGPRQVAGSEDDLLALLDRSDPVRLPRLHVSCGTEDHLLDENRRFVAAAERRGIDVTVELGPGEHEWGYWDAMLPHVLAWLPLPVPR